LLHFVHQPQQCGPPHREPSGYLSPPCQRAPVRLPRRHEHLHRLSVRVSDPAVILTAGLRGPLQLPEYRPEHHILRPFAYSIPPWPSLAASTDVGLGQAGREPGRPQRLTVGQRAASAFASGQVTPSPSPSAAARSCSSTPYTPCRP